MLHGPTNEKQSKSLSALSACKETVTAAIARHSSQYKIERKVASLEDRFSRRE
jgi:hypothetical protein